MLYYTDTLGGAALCGECPEPDEGVLALVLVLVLVLLLVLVLV